MGTFAARYPAPRAGQTTAWPLQLLDQLVRKAQLVAQALHLLHGPPAHADAMNSDCGMFFRLWNMMGCPPPTP